MLRRMIRRWLDEPTPEDGLAETLSITLRCARRCAYDLSHAAEMIPRTGAPWHDRMRNKADHWQSLFSSGTSMKDYRLKLHLDLDKSEHTVERLRAELIKLGHSGWLDDETPF